MASPSRVDSSHKAASSDLLDRLPPQNLDAEKGVLGSLLLDPLLCDDVLLVVRSDDFYSDANQKLFRHVVEMHADGLQIDVTLLVERLQGAGELESIGGMAYLAEVAQSVGVAAHAVHYAEIVRDKATLRSLIHASTEILRDAYEPAFRPDELLGQAEQKIFAIHDSRSSDQLSNINDVLMETFDLIDHRMEHGGASGIPTGFVDVDALTGGLHDSELIILAARPSMGKTAFATNIAEYVAIKEQVPVLFVSLEMARHELAQRLLASQGKIDGLKFRSGTMSKDDREKLVEASAKLSTAPLFIDDSPSRSMSQIAACARRLKRRNGLGLLVIDYLQLVQPEDPRDPRQEQVAKIARRLKGLARELKVPLVCVAQLNRQVEAGTGRESRRPRLSHLRESGAIEQDADVVMFVHREEYYHSREEALEKDLVGKGEIMVAKQRNGPTGDVKLTWLHKFTRFENLADPHGHSEFDDYGPDEGEAEF
ncbi:MAG TPA: replicative DNA helicase [Thermoguttaceae bacterium]|nr:replicative DNA helicase [Thermoguttaceae bacterium]